MREQLVGYVLGALDPVEQAEVEAIVRKDAQLREELDVLRRAVSPLECDRDHHHPPTGLAANTCRRVASLRVAVVPASTRHSAANSGGRRTSSRTIFGWNLVDIAVAAAIVVAAGLLVVPAIGHSRLNAQIANCGFNLETIGKGLGRYSMKHNGEFPMIPASGKLSAAGMYAPELISSGDVADPKVFRCSLNDANRAEAAKIPTKEELDAASPEQLPELLKRAGGSYGYTLGYQDHGRYFPTTSRGRVNFPIMADSPCEKLDYRQSSNHGGQGQNVLFEDGHVRYLTTSHQPEGCADPDFYRNNDGHVAAGKDQDDAVIGCSTAHPQEE
ncbi:MAG: hypothetical protein K8T25_15550 [Planctomycetia bacterium]|nr:hypothetical protein [Planctomycetia bacterium]